MEDEPLFTKNEGEPLTLEDVNRIFANPFYCVNIAPTMAIEHELMISEQMWIDAAVKSIEEDDDNGRNFLGHLLENLKGNHVQ